MYDYQRWVDRPRTQIKHFDVDIGKAQEIISIAKRSGLTNLPQDDALRILGIYGLPVIRTETAPSRAEAVEAGKRMGYPVAMKDPAIKNSAFRAELYPYKTSLFSPNNAR